MLKACSHPVGLNLRVPLAAAGSPLTAGEVKAITRSSICATFDTKRSELSVDKITDTVFTRSLLQGTCTRHRGRPQLEFLLGAPVAQTAAWGKESPKTKREYGGQRAAVPGFLYKYIVKGP